MASGCPVLSSLAPGATARPLSLKVSPPTHLALPDDEELPVYGDVGMLEPQQRHQLRGHGAEEVETFQRRCFSGSASVLRVPTQAQAPALQRPGEGVRGGGAAWCFGARRAGVGPVSPASAGSLKPHLKTAVTVVSAPRGSRGPM